MKFGESMAELWNGWKPKVGGGGRQQGVLSVTANWSLQLVGRTSAETSWGAVMSHTFIRCIHMIRTLSKIGLHASHDEGTGCTVARSKYKPSRPFSISSARRPFAQYRSPSSLDWSCIGSVLGAGSQARSEVIQDAALYQHQHHHHHHHRDTDTHFYALSRARTQWLSWGGLGSSARSDVTDTARHLTALSAAYWLWDIADAVPSLIHSWHEEKRLLRTSLSLSFLIYSPLFISVSLCLCRTYQCLLQHTS
jgi:hypothetical protein